MAGPLNLTGQNIEDTYQRLIQISGSGFCDGTGSAVNIISTDTLQDVVERGNQTTLAITASALNIDEIQFNNTNLYGNSIFHNDVNIYNGAAFLDEYDHEFFRSFATGQGAGYITLGPLAVETRIQGTNINLTAPVTASIISASGAVTVNELTASGLQYPSTDSDDGYVIMTNGSGVLTLEANVNYVTVKNVHGSTLTKGTPVHATGTSGNTPEVIVASASNAATMPATFVLAEDLNDDEEGRAVLSGFMNGVSTAGFTEGNNLYVAPNGGYTQTKPTGSNLIQNIAIVGKVDETNGSIFVYGSGRSNDIPNINIGYAWVGDSNQVATAVATSSFIVDNATTASFIDTINGGTF